MLPCPKIVRRQRRLTPDQEAYAREFARERSAAILSIVPIDKQEAEEHLRAAYRSARLESPATIRWFDSPRSFVQARMPYLAGYGKPYFMGSGIWGEEGAWWDGVWNTVDSSIFASVWTIAKDSAWKRVWKRMWDLDEYHAENIVRYRVGERVWTRVMAIMLDSLWPSIGNVWTRVQASALASVEESRQDTVEHVQRSPRASVLALSNASTLASYRFFHEVFEENKLIHMARFNETVSGYQLGYREAWVVCKPTLLEQDARGRLHSASGPSIQYQDGWGIYAWHGVRVPEKLILHPEQVTRKEWMAERNAEVRRAIQERLGNERFIEMVGGTQIDAGRRGKLIEVDLGPGGPEQVAHYVQVQDSSTQRHYYLRVPPFITSADEAIAWTFGMNARDYQPGQET